MRTLKPDRLKPEADSKKWWKPLGDEVELFVEAR